MLQQLEAGKSETLTAYLAAMARFHSYSFGNILQIARQRPTATRVARFHAWKEMGRFVKRGEKGIQILAPMVGQRRREEAIANATGLRVLSAISNAVPVWLIKRDLLFVAERMVNLREENRTAILARQHGIKKAKENDPSVSCSRAFFAAP